MNSKFNTSNEKPHPCADLARRMSMEVSTRLLDLKPTSYSAEYRTVDAVLSTGSAVARIYGTEVLKISPDAVDLTRVHGAGVPVLDSHQQIGLSNALGVLRAAWVEDGALIGTLQFNQTYEGKKAEGMVARREVNGVSIGYRVNDWEISDCDGDIIDPAVDRMRWSDDDLVFTASKWSLLEISLCNVPADDTAGIRAYGDRAYFPPPPAFIADVRARMGARQRMHDRHQAVLRRCSNA
jgi:HK97 family phage prohead protease